MVTLKIKQLPAWGLKSQPKITSELFHALGKAQNLMQTVNEHRHVVPIQATVEMDRFPGCVCRPSHEKAAHFACYPHLVQLSISLGPDFPSGLTGICFVAACVGCLDRPKNNMVPAAYDIGSPESHLNLQATEHQLNKEKTKLCKKETKFTSHGGIQTFFPLFVANWETKCYQLMARRIDCSFCWIDKSSKTKFTEMRNRLVPRPENSSHETNFAIIQRLL